MNSEQPGAAVSLNADLGESFGAWSMGQDQDMLCVVSDANLACGFHAGDPVVMLETLHACAQHGVGVGAHPSWPDLSGFGRRPMQVPAAETRALLLYQIAALDGLCRMKGYPLQHVKPHGAMNNQAATDPALAQTIAESIAEFNPELILLAPAGSELANAGLEAKLLVALEVFADRRYEDDGTLMSRQKVGAVIDSSDDAVAHALAMLDAGGIISQGGVVIPTPIHSICVHGDTQHALVTARTLAERVNCRRLDTLF